MTPGSRFIRVLEGTEDVEESVIDADDDEPEVEYPDAARCPPHPDVVVLSKIALSKVMFDLLDGGVVIDLLVRLMLTSWLRCSSCRC